MYNYLTLMQPNFLHALESSPVCEGTAFSETSGLLLTNAWEQAGLSREIHRKPNISPLVFKFLQQHISFLFLRWYIL